MSIKRKVLLSLFMGVWLSLASQSGAAENQLPVTEIVQRANRISDNYQGRDGRGQIRMSIFDASGKERRREFSMLKWDQPGPNPDDDSFCGDQKFYVFFHRPADVSKMAFLVHKHLAGEDDRWLYLPALSMVKRISSADKRTSFVGSHFLYEDITGRNINSDSHILMASDGDFFTLKSAPKDRDRVEFAHFVSRVRRNDFMIMEKTYFDQQGQAYRRYQVEKWETIQDYPTITRSRMTDLRTGGYTIMTYSSMEYNLGLKESLFSERYLRRPPHRYLRAR